MIARRIIMMALFVGFATMSQGQSFGIGTDSPHPSSVLEVAGSNKGILIPRMSIGNVNAAAPVAAPATSLLIFNTNPLVSGGAGVGYYYWTGAKWQPFIDYPVVYNGLNYTSVTDGIKLGGQLIEDTNIDLDASDLTFEINGGGDFIITENGDTKFRIFSSGHVAIAGNNTQGDLSINGTSFFSDDINLMHNNVNSGEGLIRLTNSGNDGLLEVYENDQLSHRIVGNGETVFNERGLDDNDFRIESNDRIDALTVDARNDVVRFGSNLNVTNQLNHNGNSIVDIFNVTQARIDYLADFDNGQPTGSTIGVGSVEYITDGNQEIFFSDILSPSTNLLVDLGWSNAWDEIYCDDIVDVSDVRAKTKITELSYGLEEILKLRPVSYLLISDPFQEKKLGLIAQETLPLIPEVVKTHNYIKTEESGEYKKQETELMRMTYIRLIPVLIKAIQEQQLQIDELKNSSEANIHTLSSEIEELKRANQVIMDRLDELTSK